MASSLKISMNKSKIAELNFKSALTASSNKGMSLKKDD